MLILTFDLQHDNRGDSDHGDRKRMRGTKKLVCLRVVLTNSIKDSGGRISAGGMINSTKRPRRTYPRFVHSPSKGETMPQYPHSTPTMRLPTRSTRTLRMTRQAKQWEPRVQPTHYWMRPC